jgi:carboxypeptidase T
MVTFNKYHFLPTLNVDGLSVMEEVYNQNGTFKMQRKNLMPNEGSQCVGVDLNRNYAYLFEVGKDKCSE